MSSLVRLKLRNFAAGGKKTQVNGWYVVAAVLTILAIQHRWVTRQQVETIRYS